MRSPIWSVPLIVLAVVFEAEAGVVLNFRTTKDGAHAVRVRGGALTLDDLVERRGLNPSRFDRHHERLGHALSLGREGLEARRELNPRRFDYYHPVLGYLLDGPQPGPSHVIGVPSGPVLGLGPVEPGGPGALTPLLPMPPIDLTGGGGGGPPLLVDPRPPTLPAGPPDRGEPIGTVVTPGPDPVAVPEPSSLVLALASLLVLGAARLVRRAASGGGGPARGVGIIRGRS